MTLRGAEGMLAPMSLLSAPPSVYVVGNDYVICALVGAECTFGVEIAGCIRHDHSNGILRSARFVHMVRFPQAELDAARAYTLHLRPILQRKPYFTEYGEAETVPFPFRPVVRKDAYRIVNIADAHSHVADPIAAGLHGFGRDLDLLVLNGDIPTDCGEPSRLRGIHEISGAITGGEVPCVFVRGNHDLRGTSAEILADYVPTDNGRTYFTFRAGPIWGIALDCGEDKLDDHPEYGRTVCCHEFRLEEDEFLDRVLASREWEGAALRLVAVHKPLANELPPPFDIEKDLFRSWCRKLHQFRPHVMLTGHLHECFVELPGGDHDDYGLPCLHACTSFVSDDPVSFTCGALTLAEDHAHVDFVDDKGVVTPGYDGPYADGTAAGGNTAR